MLHYMQSLKEQVGYVSMKTKYMERQARNFPSLPGFDTDIGSSMEENLDGETEDIVPINPIEEKDKKIASLEKSVEGLKTKEAEITQLKEALSKSSAELDLVSKKHRTSLKKLSFTQKAAEHRLLANISNQQL